MAIVKQPGFNSGTPAATRRADLEMQRQIVTLGNGLDALGDRIDYDGAWDGNHLLMGVYHLWIDSSGRLRVKNSAPLSDTDGTVVGTQS